MQNILIVEDDRELNSGIAYAPEKEGVCIGSLFHERGGAALSKRKDGVILLDVNLPDGEGFSSAGGKGKGDTQVIFLTVRTWKRGHAVRI